MKGMRVSATVILTVKVTSLSTWEPTAPCDQVFKQAGEGAMNSLKELIEGTNSMRVLGNPQVSVVVAENADD